MPRDLGDVLHYFLPQNEVGAPPSSRSGRLRSLDGPTPRPDRPAALPIVALPLGERDVVRAAYAWNLAVEVARQGASATLLAPANSEPSPLWPEPGRGPVGAEVVLSEARNFGDLNRTALDIAVSRAADSNDGGVVLVTVPPTWFRDAGDGRALVRWVLLFTAAETRDLLETYSLAKRIIAANSEARVGVTDPRRPPAWKKRRAPSTTWRTWRRGTSNTRSTSYGLLVDDLHVYRAIVSRRPIGLEHPQSRAARALRDVARLLLEDARKQAVA